MSQINLYEKNFLAICNTKMEALTTLRTEINRLGFTLNEQDSLRKYFTENVEKINVVVSFLPDYVTDDGKRGYLKSLIPGMLYSRPHRVIFTNNTEYLLILVLFFPASHVIVEQPIAGK